jgi:carboxypeptidase Taq
MPGGAGERRAEQLELMATLGHERATEPRIGEWLTSCRATPGDDEQQAAVREMQRDYDRATRLPTALVAQLAATESRAQQAGAGGLWKPVRLTTGPAVKVSNLLR